MKSDVEELKFLDEIPLNSDILLNSIRTESKSQIKALFDQHQQVIKFCHKYNYFNKKKNKKLTLINL